MSVRKINRISLYQNESWDGFKNLVHGFTTRSGGASTGAYESLSMSPRRGDDMACVRRNEKILCESLGLGLSRLTSTRQEHTDNIKIADKEHIGYGVYRDWGEGVDACVTLEKNVPLLCYSADCVPILFYAADIEAVAACHAGWRGSAANIGGKVAAELVKMGADEKNIYAEIGPCIGKCCYEVSADVAEKFSPECYDKCSNGKYMLDLAFANRLCLINAGLAAEHISESGICTKCRNDLFFSHRGQNGKSGTLGGIICMKD